MLTLRGHHERIDLHRSTDDRYFKGYVTEVVHEFGFIPVEERDVLDLEGVKDHAWMSP